jgi:hypothetical protein
MQAKSRTGSIAIVGALACGITLVASPAFAQEYHSPVGRGANDGGQVSITGATPAPMPPYRRYRPAAQTGYTYPTGRGVNDGGLVQIRVGAAVRPVRSTASQSSTPRYGRNVNDGGLVN